MDRLVIRQLLPPAADRSQEWIPDTLCKHRHVPPMPATVCNWLMENDPTAFNNYRCCRGPR